MKHRVIGIDLGTTYSAVAAFDTDSGEAEVIVDRREGDAATTPSVVGYERTSGKAIVGAAAKRNLPNDPQNTITEIKREMGEVVKDERGEDQPLTVRFADDGFLPQEISAFTLMKMKEIAEAEIGEEIRDAVITVPAWFPEPQRGATKQAALLAGLYPRQLVPEPTAAAICYGVDKDDPSPHAYLVYDLGGGTFDVSIIKVEGEEIDVIATAGDKRLGGGDFDNSIVDWAVGQLREQHGLDVAADAQARARIKFHAEQAKIRLAAAQSTELIVPELRPAEPPVLTLTREKLVELITPDLSKSKTAVEEALNRAASDKGVARDDIDAVLLVGGSTKIPEVKGMLLDYFQKDEEFVKSDLNPAAVVARGAAILAFKFQPTERPFDIRVPADESLVNPEALDVVKVTPITEHTLGVGVQEDTFHRMIDRGTNLPTKKTDHNFVNAGPTDRIEARVFQGEGEKVFDNAYIGSVWIEGLEPREAGFYNFDVTYELDVNGLLSVEVKEVNTGGTWDAKFEHESLVKTEAELLELHNKVKGMYAGGGVAAAPEPEPAEPYRPPPPTPAQEPAEVSTNGPVELVSIEPGDVPDEFRTYVRRARKHLADTFDPELAKAFNAFATAVNAHAPEDEVLNLGDTLTEALDDARRSRS